MALTTEQVLKNTQDLLNRVKTEGITDNTGNYVTQNGKTYTPVIAADSLNQALRAVNLPTAPTDNTNYSGLVAGGNATINSLTATPATDSSQTPAWLKTWMDIQQAPTNPIDTYNSLYSASGIDEKTTAVNESQNKISALKAQLEGINAETTQAGLKLPSEGISAGAIAGRNIANERDAAIRALPVQAQILAENATLTGNTALLTQAQDKLNTSFKLQSDYEDRLYNYNKSLRDSVFEFATKEQQAKLDAQNKADTQAYNLASANRNDANQFALKALETGQGSLMAQITALNSKDPNFQTKLAGLAGQIKPKAEKTTTTNASGASITPMSILDIQRYQEAYPDAGIIAGDSEASAIAKVQGLNTPKDYSDTELTALATQAKTAKVSYEDAIAEIDNDPTVKNKDLAKQVFAKVYGKKIEQPVYGTGNFSKISIDDRINQLKAIGGAVSTKSALQTQLRQNGYSEQDIFNKTANIGEKFLDSISNFLFGKK